MSHGIQYIISGESEVRYGAAIRAVAGYLGGGEGTGALAQTDKHFKRKEEEKLQTYINGRNLRVKITRPRPYPITICSCKAIISRRSDKNRSEPHLISRRPDKSSSFDDLNGRRSDKSSSLNDLNGRRPDKNSSFDNLISRRSDKSSSFDDLISRRPDKSSTFDDLNGRRPDKSSSFDDLNGRMPSVKIKVFECRQAFSPGRNQHFNHH